MSKNIEFLALASIVMNAGTQFRAALSEDAVKDYAARLREWKESNILGKDGKPLEPRPALDKWSKCPLPPIEVIRTKEGDINVDGFHRIKAAKEAKLDFIPAEVRDGTSEDAVLAALGANSDHGVKLTSEDLHKKLKAALKLETLRVLSNNALSKKIGASETFVRTNRPAKDTPKEVVAIKGGKEVKIKAGAIGKKGGSAAKKKAAEKKKAKADKKAGKSTPVTDSGEGKLLNDDGTPMTEEEALAASLAAGEAGDDTKKFDDETEKALARIKKSVSEITDADKLEEAIRSGSIEISTRDIRALAANTPSRICLAYPLVFGEKRMKPTAALAFLDKKTDADTKLSHLFNLTTATGGAVEEKVEGFTVLVIPNKDYAILKNSQLGSYFVHLKENAAEALAAIKEA